MASLPTVALLLGPEPVELTYTCSPYLPPRTVAAAVAELGHVLPGDLVALQAAAGGPSSPRSRLLRSRCHELPPI